MNHPNISRRAFFPALAAAFLALAPGAVPAAEIKPGEIVKDCPSCPEMVVVPPGSFVMGTPEKGDANERPPVKVTIAKPFALSKTEITFDQWEECAKAGACKKEPHDHRWGRGSRPVINVNFDEAVAYAQWMSKLTGQRYRLPSEAEWEYAAKAGRGGAFWWGDEIVGTDGKPHANCYDCKSQWAGKASAPVASFPPNPFGLYDMNGNVWEMTQDCWNPDHRGANTDGTWRTGSENPAKCKDRVMRGGSWYYIGFRARAASRAKTDGALASYDMGIRLLRELP